MSIRRAGGAVFDRLVGQYGKTERPAREVGRYRDVIAVLDRFESDAPALDGSR